jgi:ATP-dependent DNA helicase RecQ
VPERIAAAQIWLDQRDTPIAATTRPPMSPGLAVLNGELRSRLFVDFMRNRASDSAEPTLTPALQHLLLEKLTHLQRRHRFNGVIALPSRTWRQRDATLQLLGTTLNVPVYGDLLMWDPVPAARQGELLNNDQRRQNVSGKLRLAGELPVFDPGALLLVDDYIGSGATLREAVSALRHRGLRNDLVPLTIARVRWRLGARGII